MGQAFDALDFLWFNIHQLYKKAKLHMSVESDLVRF